MRTLIVGAGAVGGFVAARMAGHGLDVDVLARPASAARLRAHGLTLTDGTTSETFKPGVVTAGELSAPFDLVILAVKADALDQALDDAAPAIGPATVVVPFINGLGHLDAMTSRLGPAAAGGVLRVSTDRQDDGSIAILSPLFEAELGELDGSATSRIEAVADVLRQAGATVTVSPDIVSRMWVKWVFIASLGALTSLMRAPVGDIAALAAGRGLAAGLLAEIAAVADAAGHALDAGTLAAVGGQLTAAGSPMTASLSRDLMAGHPTEVEPVLGDLVERGHRLGLSLPLTGLAALSLRVHNRRVGEAQSG
jgi:2-dehydropantoate 2-reductase